MKVRFVDGGEISGWRALPWVIEGTVLALPWILLLLLAIVIQRVSPRAANALTNACGYELVGKGSMRRRA